MQSKIQRWLYIMLHMPCQMQEMHKGKLYICYKRSSHTRTQEIKQTPTSPHKRVKVAWSRGLVKISASWLCVGTWIKVIFPFSMLSLKKWYLTSMCLVLEWRTLLDFPPKATHKMCCNCNQIVPWTVGCEKPRCIRLLRRCPSSGCQSFFVST
jgi:hypothetical protein